MYEAEERGIQQGIQQVKLEMAVKLYRNGWNIDDISQIVELSAELLKQKIVESQ